VSFGNAYAVTQGRSDSAAIAASSPRTLVSTAWRSLTSDIQATTFERTFGTMVS